MEGINIMPGSIRLVRANCVTGIGLKERSRDVRWTKGDKKRKPWITGTVDRWACR